MRCKTLLFRYLKDYEDSTLKGTRHLPENTDPWQKAAEATFHPLMAYRMVRRFSHEFQRFVNHMHLSLESRMNFYIFLLQSLYTEN